MSSLFIGCLGMLLVVPLSLRFYSVLLYICDLLKSTRRTDRDLSLSSVMIILSHRFDNLLVKIIIKSYAATNLMTNSNPNNCFLFRSEILFTPGNITVRSLFSTFFYINYLFAFRNPKLIHSCEGIGMFFFKFCPVL